VHLVILRWLGTLNRRCCHWVKCWWHRASWNSWDPPIELWRFHQTSLRRVPPPRAPLSGPRNFTLCKDSMKIQWAFLDIDGTVSAHRCNRISTHKGTLAQFKNSTVETRISRIISHNYHYAGSCKIQWSTSGQCSHTTFSSSSQKHLLSCISSKCYWCRTLKKSTLMGMKHCMPDCDKHKAMGRVHAWGWNNIQVVGSN
jgi:hypothetical protein